MSSIYKKTGMCIIVLLLLARFFLPQGLHAGEAVTYFEQGTVYLESNRLGEAVDALTKAIEQNPLNVEAYNNRALAYYEQGMYGQAKADLLRALSISPDNEVANSNLGILFLEKGRYDQALLYLERAVSHNKDFRPCHAVIYCNLAFIYAKKGMNDKAKEALRRASMITQASRQPPSFLERPFEREGEGYMLVLKVWRDEEGQ